MRAVAEKPHDTVIKFDSQYVSKCTAASRGPPCNSASSCFTFAVNNVIFRLDVGKCAFSVSMCDNGNYLPEHTVTSTPVNMFRNKTWSPLV